MLPFPGWDIFVSSRAQPLHCLAMQFESFRWEWPDAVQQTWQTQRRSKPTKCLIAQLFIQTAPHCKWLYRVLATWVSGESAISCYIILHGGQTGGWAFIVKTLIANNDLLACNACEKSCPGHLRKQGHHFVYILFTLQCCMLMSAQWNAATMSDFHKAFHLDHHLD